MLSIANKAHSPLNSKANFKQLTEVYGYSTSFISLRALLIPPLYFESLPPALSLFLFLPPPPLLFFCFCYLVRTQNFFVFVLYLGLWQKQLLRKPAKLPCLILMASSTMLIGLTKNSRFLFQTIPYIGARINFKFYLIALINKPLKIRRNLIPEITLIHWPNIQNA